MVLPENDGGNSDMEVPAGEFEGVKRSVLPKMKKKKKKKKRRRSEELVKEGMR